MEYSLIFLILIIIATIVINFEKENIPSFLVIVIGVGFTALFLNIIIGKVNLIVSTLLSLPN